MKLLQTLVTKVKALVPGVDAVLSVATNNPAVVFAAFGIGFVLGLLA